MTTLSVMLGVFSLALFFAFGEGFARFYAKVQRELPGANQLRIETDWWRVDGRWVKVQGATARLPLTLQRELEEVAGSPVTLRSSQQLSRDGRPIFLSKNFAVRVVLPSREGCRVVEQEVVIVGPQGLIERIDNSFSTQLKVAVWRDGNLVPPRIKPPPLGELPRPGEGEALLVYPKAQESWRLRELAPECFVGAVAELSVPFVAIPDLRLLMTPELLPPESELIRTRRVRFRIVGVFPRRTGEEEEREAVDFTDPADRSAADLFIPSTDAADLVEELMPMPLMKQIPPALAIGESNLQSFLFALVGLRARGYLREIDLGPLIELHPKWKSIGSLALKKPPEREPLGPWDKPWLSLTDRTRAILTTARRIQAPETEPFEYAWEPWFPITAVVQTQSEKQVEALREYLVGRYGLRVFDIYDKFKPLRRLSLVVRVLTSGIGLVALLISVLGITAVLVMAVAERTRQIGIQRAVGATGADIAWVYLGMALVVGLVAVPPGFVLARLAGEAVDRYLNELIATYETLRDFLFDQPQVDIFHFTPELFLMVLVVTLLACLVSALIPALRAARLDPVEALRHE